MGLIVTLYFLVSFACDLVVDRRGVINRALDELEAKGTITSTQHTDITEFLDGLGPICVIFRLMVFGSAP